MATVLVTYATSNGRTAQLAEIVAAGLRGAGCAVQVRSARGVREPVDDFDLVVVGSPWRGGRWHRDTRRFLKRHADELRRVPVAVFASGAPVGGSTTVGRAFLRRTRLAPVASAVFGGTNRPGRGGEAGAFGDAEADWAAVRCWGSRLGWPRVVGFAEPTGRDDGG
jgi:menaquinone-dependent protoporphyrinogen oxidase